MLVDALTTDLITIQGHNGDDIEAYVARPLSTDAKGGVVVIHHLPGFDRGTKEIARRFAEMGYLAICPNLYSREAPGAAPDDAAAAVRALGGIPDAQLVGDVDGAAGWLRSQDDSNGKVGVIGYCSGGRQAFLAAVRLQLDAAVDCYGAAVVAAPGPTSVLKVTPLIDESANLSCPLLGLFGAEDKTPSPEETAELDRVLTELGKVHEFHTFEGAGHAFFATHRTAYNVEAANEGWELIDSWFARYLEA